jgi:hypothetical protein
MSIIKLFGPAAAIATPAFAQAVISEPGYCCAVLSHCELPE